MNNTTIISSLGKLKAKLHDLTAKRARHEAMLTTTDMTLKASYQRALPKLDAEIATVTGRIAVLEEDLKRSSQARRNAIDLKLLVLKSKIDIAAAQFEALEKERDAIEA